MARPADLKAQYRVKPHIVNSYTHTSTQPPCIDPATGKKKYSHIHWGTVDDNLKFIPSSAFFLASSEDRAQLIFPEEWDMSEAKRLTGLRESGRPAYNGDDQNRFYGDIWLLEQIATKTGIRKDLETVFGGNREFVDDILTLAMFPYLTNFNYNRVARWQKIAAAPSSREGAVVTNNNICAYSKWQDAGVIIATGLHKPGEIEGRIELEKAKQLRLEI